MTRLLSGTEERDASISRGRLFCARGHGSQAISSQFAMRHTRARVDQEWIDKASNSTELPKRYNEDRRMRMATSIRQEHTVQHLRPLYLLRGLALSAFASLSAGRGGDGAFALCGEQFLVDAVGCQSVCKSSSYTHQMQTHFGNTPPWEMVT